MTEIDASYLDNTATYINSVLSFFFHKQMLFFAVGRCGAGVGGVWGAEKYTSHHPFSFNLSLSIGGEGGGVLSLSNLFLSFLSILFSLLSLLFFILLFFMVSLSHIFTLISLYPSFLFLPRDGVFPLGERGVRKSGGKGNYNF